VFGLASAAGLLVAGTTGRRSALAVVGIVGMVMFLPATVLHFFAGTVGVPVLLLLAGVVLLAVTLIMLRCRRHWPQVSHPGRPKGDPRSDLARPTPPPGRMQLEGGRQPASIAQHQVEQS
jgi:hypothetical protein